MFGKLTLENKYIGGVNDIIPSTYGRFRFSLISLASTYHMSYIDMIAMRTQIGTSCCFFCLSMCFEWKICGNSYMSLDILHTMGNVLFTSMNFRSGKFFLLFCSLLFMSIGVATLHFAKFIFLLRSILIRKGGTNTKRNNLWKYHVLLKLQLSIDGARLLQNRVRSSMRCLLIDNYCIEYPRRGCSQ